MCLPQQEEALNRPAEAQRILSLFVSGADIGAIVRAIYGVTSGRPYQQRSAEGQVLLRTAL
jgi:hypothetical protein